MQIQLPVLATHGFDGIKAYIAASDAYLQSTGHRRTLDFAFPNIQKECPVCRSSGCARWKGYYERGMLDAGLGVIGPVVIRYGRCRRFKSEFSYLPDFLLPRRRLTLPTIASLQIAIQARTATMQSAIEAVVSPLGERLYIPISTAHSTLRHAQLIIKFRNIRTTVRRKVLRYSSTPERIRSLLLSSIFEVCRILKMPDLSPP